MAGKFTLDISAWCAKAGRNGRLVAQKVVIDVDTAIVEKTPVGDPDTWKMPAPAGYVGGRARGSWQYAKGAPDETDPGTIDASGSVAIGRVVAGVMSGDAADAHYLTTTVPYMRRLEYEGWSGQAPDGMIRKTIAEFQEHVSRAVRELP